MNPPIVHTVYYSGDRLFYTDEALNQIRIDSYHDYDIMVGVYLDKKGMFQPIYKDSALEEELLRHQRERPS